jgi:hypothetical protein
MQESEKKKLVISISAALSDIIERGDDAIPLLLLVQ